MEFILSQKGEAFERENCRPTQSKDSTLDKLYRTKGTNW